MAQTKQYKPRTCEQCLVIKKEKGTLICGVMRKLKAKANSTQEKLQMWRKCPLDWDK
jgi:hypothetical protein